MMRLYRNFLLIAAFTASLSYGGWRGSYNTAGAITTSGGKVTNITLADDGRIQDENGNGIQVSASNGRWNNVDSGSEQQNYYLSWQDDILRQDYVYAWTGLSGGSPSNPSAIPAINGISTDALDWGNGCTDTGASGAARNTDCTGTGQSVELENVNGQKLVFSGGGLTVPVAATLNAGATIASGQTLTVGGDITFADAEGAITWDGGASIAEDASDNLEVNGPFGGRVEIQTNGTNRLYVSATETVNLNNTGINVSGTGNLTVGGDITFGDAEGAITWDGGASIAEDATDGLVFTAGDAAGADLLFHEGTGDGEDTRLSIFGGGSIGTFKSDGLAAELLGASLTIAYGGAQIGNADGEKLYFGGTSHYLEWDTTGNRLLFNGSAANYLDLDSYIARLATVEATSSLQADTGFLGLGTPSELTIAETGGEGIVTPTKSFHLIDTESDAASDDLDEIDDANASDGDRVCFLAVSGARDVTYKHDSATTTAHRILFPTAVDLTAGNNSGLVCFTRSDTRNAWVYEAGFGL